MNVCAITVTVSTLWSLRRHWNIIGFINSSRDLFQFSWAGVCTQQHRHYHHVVSHESLKKADRTLYASRRKERRQSRERTNGEKEKTAKKMSTRMKNSRKHQSTETETRKAPDTATEPQKIQTSQELRQPTIKATVLHASEGERSRHKARATSREMIPRQ